MDDSIDEDEETVTISHSVSTTADAPNYPTTLAVDGVEVTVTDNDTPGEQLTPFLVKNTAQTTGPGRLILASSANDARAQQFTTGGNLSGYTVSSIGFLFQEISNTGTAGNHLTVTLNASANDDPGTTLCTFTDPATFTASGTQTFDAPATDPCPTLTPDTSYFVVIERVVDVSGDVISLESSTSTAEDPNPATGWSIGDGRHFGSSNTWSSTTSQPYQIEITGNTLASYNVPVSWPLKPDGLVGGDQFRLLFISSAAQDATSADIATYNRFARTQAAAGHTDILPYSPGFTAVASTPSDDARDNTKTTYVVDDLGVPIYWVDGTKVADNYQDFYDGSWNDETNATNQSGAARSTSTASDYPFTGSSHDGTQKTVASTSQALGTSATNVAVGRPDSAASGDGPLSGATQTAAKTDSRPMYVISRVFTVDTTETLIWEGTLTVGQIGNIIGYNQAIPTGGSLTNRTFTYKGRTTSATQLTTSQLEGETQIFLGITGFFERMDPILTNWSLHLGTEVFPHTKGERAGNDNLYTWDANTLVGLAPPTFNVGEQIRVKLTTTEPSAPTNFTAVEEDPDGTTVTLNWITPTTGGSAITNYQYRQGGLVRGTHQDWTDIPGDGTITTAHVAFPAGWPDGPYPFEIRAVNDTGPGLWSETVLVNVFDERGLSVTNTNQTAESSASSLSDTTAVAKRAQQFTTGANPAGYTLTAASIKFHTISNTSTAGAHLTVTLNATTSGDPDSSALCTLTDPPTFATAGVNTFTAPNTDPCPALTADTPYFIVVERVEHVSADAISLNTTGSTDEDAASAVDWSIGDSLYYFSSSTWNSTASKPHLIAVNAATLPNAPYTPDAPSVTATPGTTDSLNVSWPTPDNPGRQDITDFDLQYQKVTETTWTNWPHDGTALSATITSLDAGTAYKVRLRATNAIGPSPWSEPRQAPTDTTPTVVLWNWGLAPAGLTSGNQFRLIFATSTTRDARSADINDYNTFVRTTAAAGHTDIQAHSDSFAVVGSTTSIHARDNTVTTFTNDDKGVPIYWLDGNKAADDYEDFYDGSWDDQVNYKNESGNARSLGQAHTYPFTGTEHNGTEAFDDTGNSVALGAPKVRIPHPNTNNLIDEGPLGGFTEANQSDSRPFYALSAVFEVGLVVNSDATGVPTITGTPRVGEVLTADTSGINDYDGLTTVSYAYQWITFDGSDDANIAGATASTYTIKPEDAGKQLKVKVTFTDDLENPEGPLYSALTDPVNIPATGAPTISGTPRVGETLTADTADISDEDGNDSATFTYQWVRIDGGTQTNVGTDASTYIIAPDDETNKVKVQVTFTDDGDHAEGPLDSLPTDTVVSADLLVKNTDQTIASHSGINAAAPRAAQAFTTGPHPHGYTLNSIGVRFNLIASPSLAADLLTATVNPTTSGNPGTSVCTLTDPDTFVSRSINTFTASSCELNANTQYFVVIARTGTDTSVIRLERTASADEDAYSAPNWSIAHSRHETLSGSWTSVANEAHLIQVHGEATPATNNPAIGLPTITGTPRVNEVLTAVTTGIQDEDGLDNVIYAYQWVRDNTDIVGATSSTYTLQPADARNRIKVRVTFADDADFVEEPLTSAPTVHIALSNLLTQNTRQTTAAVARTLDSITSKAAQTFTTGAYADGYTIESVGFAVNRIGTTSTAGDQLTVTLNSVNNSGNPGPVLCTLADPATFRASGLHAFTPPASGDDLCPTLTASTTYAAVIDRNTITDYVAFSITESSDEHTAQADGWSIGDNLHRYTSSWGTTSGEILQIRITGHEAPPFVNSTATGLPTITGDPRVGEILTADTSAINDENGLTMVSYAYQWITFDGSTDTDIAGATSSTYTIKPEDAGKQIKVKVTFTDDLETPEGPLYSALTGPVNTPASGAPTISGTPRVGETLTADTADISDADGTSSATFTYQWVRVDGETQTNVGTDASTYIIAPNDEDNRIKVQVTFTDDVSHAEGPLDSLPTDTVIAADLLVKNTGQTSSCEPQRTGWSRLQCVPRRSPPALTTTATLSIPSALSST